MSLRLFGEDDKEHYKAISYKHAEIAKNSIMWFWHSGRQNKEESLGKFKYHYLLSYSACVKNIYWHELLKFIDNLW